MLILMDVSRHLKFIMACKKHVRVNSASQLVTKEKNLFLPILDVVSKRKKYPFIRSVCRVDVRSKGSQSSYLGRALLWVENEHWKWILMRRNWKASVMAKVNPYHEKLFSMLSMKWRRERKNSTVSHELFSELCLSPGNALLLVSKQEIESLCTIFRHLTKGGDKGISRWWFLLILDILIEKIDRNRFRDILHNTFDMTDDILMDRGMFYRVNDDSLKRYSCSSVFKAFDRDNDGQVSMLEWVVGLNTYLRGTLDEKIACKRLVDIELLISFGILVAFNCYSLKGEKHITREEIFQLLKSSVLKVSARGHLERKNNAFVVDSKLVMKIRMRASKNWSKSPWKRWTKIMTIVWATMTFRLPFAKILFFSLASGKSLLMPEWVF